MMIEKLRAALLLVLIAMFTWVAAGIGLDAAQHAALPFPNASLCIHSSGS